MKNKNLLISILIIALSLWSVLPILQPGYFPMHDDTQPARVFEMAKSLKAGMFPVRWVFDLGYGLGYPIFNYYAPLAYYFGAIFVLLGFGSITATKIMMATGVLLSGVFMYLFTKDIWGKIGGIVSALFYVYVPYHAVNVYVRGAVSEFWAYAFIPLVFFGLTNAFKTNKLRHIAFGAIGYAGVILSHNLTALMITPLVILYALCLSLFAYKDKKPQKIYQLISVLVLGALLSAFYWLPALTEIKNTNVASQLTGGSDFKNNFVCLDQFWNSPWGFGGSTTGCLDGMSFVLGKVHILIFLLSLMVLIVLPFLKIKTRKTFFALSTFLLFILSIFLMTEAALPIWKSISPMQYLQYPWRFLNISAFSSSILAGFLVWSVSKIFHKNALSYQIIVALFISVLLLFLNAKYFNPQKIIKVDDSYYTSDVNLKWRISKISDEYLPKNIDKPKTVNNALKNKTTFSFRETSIERLSDYVSVAGILALIAGIIYAQRNAKDKKAS